MSHLKRPNVFALEPSLLRLSSVRNKKWGWNIMVKAEENINMYAPVEKNEKQYLSNWK